jgi:hypothetical protein
MSEYLANITACGIHNDIQESDAVNNILKKSILRPASDKQCTGIYQFLMME